MIRIPTCELVGILSDTVPFACTDDMFPEIAAIRLTWDGGRMHADATDRYVWGHAHWRPGDDPPADMQEGFDTDWGGADDPWTFLIPVDTAQKIIAVFKLPVKQGWTELQVDYLDHTRLRIARLKDTGHPPIKHTIGSAETGTATFPDRDKYIKAVSGRISTILLDQKKLAVFAKVRRRGALDMKFAGPGKAVQVTIGERFDGAIMPLRPADKPAPAEPQPAVDVLDMGELPF